MVEVQVNRDILAGAQCTWDLLADWGDTAWLPGVPAAELIEGGEGLATRRFPLPGQGPLDEILLSADHATRELRYTIPRAPVLPFDDYIGTVAVRERPGGCRVEWACTFGSGDLPENEAGERARANLERLLDGLQGYLESLRVVQWATGRVGCSSLRAVVRHPGMQLVGLKVHTPEKAGRDAGELCGLDEPVGIAATCSREEILDLKPDCVLYMQEGYDADDLCALLAAGINVVTTRGEFFNPDRMDPALRDRIEAACLEGGASIHATGSSPGFITEAVPLVLTSLSRRLDCLTIDEYADIPKSVSTEMILQVMGFGRPAGGEFDPGLLHHMAQCFEQSLGSIADALSLSLDGFETSGEQAHANSRVELDGGEAIEAGTVAAQRITVAGMRDGRPVLRFRANWFCSTDIDSDWKLEADGWRVLVEGDTPLDVRIGFPPTEQPVADQMSGLTAHRAVNAVPFVCAAEPGIRTTADLPQVVARLG